jgi:hypothetical protein
MAEKNWIKNAIKPKNKGKLRKELGVKKGEDIPEKKLLKAAKSKNPTLRKEAILAETLRKLPRKGKKTKS